jgi:hypothetical protein
MANSLIELYGGGMVGKSNNYQLGGRIARSRRRRDFKGEMRKLREKQEAANRRKKKSGFLGSLGSLAGGALGFALAGPAGAAIGAGLGRGAGESSYAREDYSGGKYAQDTRGSLRDAEDDYRKGIGERALVTGLQAAIMPGVYDKIGQVAGQGVSFVKGLPEAFEAGKEMGLTGAQTFGDYAKSFSPSSALAGASFNPMATAGAMTTGPTQAVQDLGLAENIDYSMARDAYAEMYPNQSSSILDFYNTFDLQGQGFNRQGGMIPKYPHGGPVHTNMSAEALAKMQQQQALPAAQQTSTVSNYASSAVSPMSTQTTPTMGGIDTEALSGLSASGFNMGDFLGGSVLGDGSGVDLGIGTGMGFTPGTGTGTGTGTAGATGGASVTDPSGTYSGYGTAIDPMAALGQMGMGNIASDPRLQKYLKDLPQFGMGYQQQFGDVQAGGRQALSQMYAAQRNMGGGFAGAGAGAQAFGQGYSGLMGEQARQRRGVVEGFQSDLLSSIRDIEEKGDFTFGQGDGGMTKDQMRIQDLIDQGYSADEAERQIYQDNVAGETYG